MAKKSKAAIRGALVSQLAKNGAVGDHMLDLVEDYIEMVGVKNALEKDIKVRGVVVDKELGDGRTVKVKNDSVAELVKVNAQMVKLLAYLQVKPDVDAIMEDDTL